MSLKVSLYYYITNIKTNTLCVFGKNHQFFFINIEDRALQRGIQNVVLSILWPFSYYLKSKTSKNMLFEVVSRLRVYVRLSERKG